MSPRWVALLLALGAVGLLLLADLGTKRWAAEELRRWGPRPVVAGLELAFRENSGAAFGLFRGQPSAVRGPLLLVHSVATALVLGTLLVWRLLRRPPSRLLTAGLVALLAGTLGNLWDRATRGVVVDFIDFTGHALEWPAFNLADAYLSLGLLACVAALLLGLFGEKAEGAAASRPR